MSVQQLESAIKALSPEERRQLADWFDDHREELVDDPDVLSEEQKAEVLRRRAAFLADPSIAEAWEGTTEQVREHLHARRAKKTAAGGR